MNFRCSRCTRPVYPKNFPISPDGKILCHECFDRLYFVCTSCGDKRPIEEKCIHAEQAVCPNCMSWLQDEA